MNDVKVHYDYKCIVASFVFGLLAAIATWCEEPKQT